MSEWRTPTPAELESLWRVITPAQEATLRNLLERMGQTTVRLRVVEEFDGQMNVPVALEVVGGTRFVIDPEGIVAEYPREDE